eukprot:13835779-Alexandrium_andersonii.AAC.1
MALGQTPVGWDKWLMMVAMATQTFHEALAPEAAEGRHIIAPAPSGLLLQAQQAKHVQLQAKQAKQ